MIARNRHKRQVFVLMIGRARHVDVAHASILRGFGSLRWYERERCFATAVDLRHLLAHLLRGVGQVGGGDELFDGRFFQ